MTERDVYILNSILQKMADKMAEKMAEERTRSIESIFQDNVKNKFYEKTVKPKPEYMSIKLRELRHKIANFKNISLAQIKIKQFHTVPVRTRSNGELHYESNLSLLDAASQSVDVMRLVAETLGFKMQLDQVGLLEFLYKINEIEITDELINHISYCTESFDYSSIVEYIIKLYPDLLPGEALYLYLFGDLRITKDVKHFDLNFLNSVHHIDSWRPFGILLLVKHVLTTNRQRYKKMFPIRVCLEYLTRDTSNATLENAPSYFLLGMSNYSDMVNSMNTMGIIPHKNIEYEKYLIHTIHRYRYVLNRNYGSTFDIIHWDNDKESRDFFFKNTIAYGMYNDRELLSMFGIDIVSDIIGRKNIYWVPELPKDYEVVKWRFSYFGCNDSMYKTIDGTGKEIIQKLDLNEDIVIAYGTFRNHRCWTASIIADGYNPVDSQFMVPGYLPIPNRDSSYPNDSLSDQKYFSEDQIIELYLMLSTLKKSMRPKNVVDLLEILKEYITANKNVYIDSLKAELATIEPKYHVFLRWFFFWDLLLSLYTRRWKGVGYPYPYSFNKEEHIQGESEGESLCSEAQSVTWITGQIRRYRALMNMNYATVSEQDNWDELRKYLGTFIDVSGLTITQDEETLENLKGIVNMIEKIRIVEIDFGNLKPMIINSGDSNLVEVLEKFVKEEVCAPHLSDMLRNTAVYHIINLFDYQLDNINELFRQFIYMSLSEYGANSENIPIIELDNFYTTGHIDPYLNLKKSKDVIKREYEDKIGGYISDINLYLSEHSYYWSNVPINDQDVIMID